MQTPTNKTASCGVERILPLPEPGDLTVPFSAVLSIEPTIKIKFIINFSVPVIDRKYYFSLLLLDISYVPLIKLFSENLRMFVMFHENIITLANKFSYFYQAH